jgi:hypothetical protein
VLQEPRRRWTAADCEDDSENRLERIDAAPSWLSEYSKVRFAKKGFAGQSAAPPETLT